MAASYTQPTAVVNPSFGAVIPAQGVDPLSASDRVERAFRAGFLTTEDLQDAFLVKPIQRRAAQAKAADEIDLAKANIKVRPEMTQLALDKAKLDLNTAKKRSEDPHGISAYFEKELAGYGIVPTGDLVEDSRALSRAKRDYAYEEAAVDVVQKTGIERQPGESAEAYLIRARTSSVEADKRLQEVEADNERKTKFDDSVNAELLKLGAMFSPDDPLPVRQALLSDLRGEEKKEKAAGVGAKPTEAQARTSVYLAELEQTNKVIEELESSGYRPQDSYRDYLATRSVVTAPAASEGGRRFFAASEKWIEAVLRDRSGAAVPVSEYGNARKQYFPVPGDSEAIVADKRRLRAAAEQAMRLTVASGGRGVFMTPDGSVTPVTDAPAAEPSQVPAPAAPTSAAPPPAPAAVPAPSAVAPNVKQFRLRDGRVIWGAILNNRVVETDPQGNPL